MPEGEGGGDCVKVAIRCRPPSQKEINNKEGDIVEMNEAFGGDGSSGQVVLNDPSGNEEPSKFAFDIVFGLAVKQSQIYESIGRPALLKTFEGFNGTIFAYGQTGSGKSFTMGGVAGHPELRGITPRVNEELFERIQEQQVGTRRFLVMCSYFEIYNEIIFDLLNPVADKNKVGGGLQIKEHPVMGIYVKDLTEIVAEGSAKLEEMMDTGMKNRAVSATNMNSVSSRSHSIFAIKVHQKDTDDPSRNVFAKLNLVDLAGSERQKGTGATGQTLKEGANINKSLSALGNVINALVESANGKKVFIPYRNSKLTRVLQESLGGNSLCTMLATLSPASCNYEETMSTLRYANRAKAIKVSATKNEEASQISRLKAEVEELKKKLGATSGGGPTSSGLSEAERKSEQEIYERQLKDMENMLNTNWGEKAKLSEEHQKNMARIAEQQRKAAQAVEEERAKRLKLLQDKNDLELSIRGFTDFVLALPKLEKPPPVLVGEQSRQWLKLFRTMRQHRDDLKEQHTMVLVHKHAFDEDVKLWGEGVEGQDMNLASTGLNRCLAKLLKFKKGSEKLGQLYSQGLAAASEISESVGTAFADMDKFMQKNQGTEEGGGETSEQTASTTSGKEKSAALEEVCRMLQLVRQQVQEKADELTQLACIDMHQTCELMIKSARGSQAEAVVAKIHVLDALMKDPSLAALPSGLPLKPLRDYGPNDVVGTPGTTEALLAQIIRWEGLCGGKTKKSAQELLTRPPPKFLLDVTMAVKASTGFPPGIDSDWPEVREERLARFQGIADAVAAELSCTIDFDPADVLKGKETAKTLKLLEMLAVAGARKLPPPQKKENNALTRPRELTAILNAMDQCVHGAKQAIEAKRQAAIAAADMEETLEAKISVLEQQLEEESQARMRSEEILADTEKELQESQSAAKKVTNELELNQQLQDPEQLELERQVGDLLKEASSAAEMPEEAMISMLATQIQEVKRELQQDEADVQSLEEKHGELEKTLANAAVCVRQLEAEVAREKKRLETEQELAGQSPEEQKMILEAHEQKLRTRAETLETQIAQLLAEAEERKATNLKTAEEGNDLRAKTEDAQLQTQIIQEERDAIREAMEQLWSEKALVDEELQYRMQGYINLSERLNSQQDENGELEALVEKMSQEVSVLQKSGFAMAPAAA